MSPIAGVLIYFSNFLHFSAPSFSLHYKREKGRLRKLLFRLHYEIIHLTSEFIGNHNSYGSGFCMRVYPRLSD